MNEIVNTTTTTGVQQLPKEKLIEIANLEIDCKIGKDRHFIAADRKNRLRIWLGMFSVVGSAVMASEAGPSLAKLIQDYLVGWNHVGQTVKFLGSLLPLSVGISTAIIGFLGLEKQTAQHRFVGNAYIEIARKARSLINDINLKNNNSEEYLKKYDELLLRYLEINKEGEGCPTNGKDSDKAMWMNKKRRNAVKAKLQEFDMAVLGIKEHVITTKITLWSAIKRGIKYRMAHMFLFFGCIRKSDYRKFLTTI